MDKLQEYVDWYHSIPRSRWVVDDFLKITKAHMDEQHLHIVIKYARGLLTTQQERLGQWSKGWVL